MDEYLGFTFNGKSLETFNGFIKNDFEELAFNMPTFSNSFVTPTYGNKPFYLGNTKEHRTFELDIVLNEITLDKYRRFLEWLGMDKKGVLKFDYNPNYGYDVKLDNIEKANFVVVPQRDTNCDPSDDKYIIEIPITFITTGDWAARWVHIEPVWKGIDHPDNNDVDNDKVSPDNTWIVNPRADDFTFYNRHSVNNAIKIEFKGTMEILGVTLQGTTDPTVTNTYLSEYGIIIGSDGAFGSAKNEEGKYVEIPKLIIEPGKSWSGEITGGWTSIKPTSREII